MSATITIPAELESQILGKAKADGKPFEKFTIGLIEQGLQSQPPVLTFDEILAPFRKEVAESGITDVELDSLFMRARQDYARENQEQE